MASCHTASLLCLFVTISLGSSPSHVVVQYAGVFEDPDKLALFVNTTLDFQYTSTDGASSDAGQFELVRSVRKQLIGLYGKSWMVFADYNVIHETSGHLQYGEGMKFTSAVLPTVVSYVEMNYVSYYGSSIQIDRVGRIQAIQIAPTPVPRTTATTASEPATTVAQPTTTKSQSGTGGLSISDLTTTINDVPSTSTKVTGTTTTSATLETYTITPTTKVAEPTTTPLPPSTSSTDATPTSVSTIQISAATSDLPSSTSETSTSTAVSSTIEAASTSTSKPTSIGVKNLYCNQLVVLIFLMCSIVLF